MENIGIGELRSNPVADQCLKCFQGLFQLFWEKAPGLNSEKICGILGYFGNSFRSVNC